MAPEGAGEVEIGGREGMSKFKAGDRVVCVNNAGAEGSLVEGKVYTVTMSVAGNHAHFIAVADDGGTPQPRDWRTERFVLEQAGSVGCARPADDIASEVDAVRRPPHYANFPIEPVTFINACGLPFNRGNAIKYLCRAGLKDATKEIEDLQKAGRYIEMEIECVRRRQRVAAGEDRFKVWREIL